MSDMGYVIGLEINQKLQETPIMEPRSSIRGNPRFSFRTKLIYTNLFIILVQSYDRMGHLYTRDTLQNSIITDHYNTADTPYPTGGKDICTHQMLTLMYIPPCT